MKISIVIGTHNRAHLLEQSFECYLRNPFKDFEIILMDNGSTDHTDVLCEQYLAKGLDIKYLRLEMPEGVEWMDSSAYLNKGIAMAKGEFIIPTHPEIMVSKDTLIHTWGMYQRWCAGYEDNNVPAIYICAKIYFLTPERQRILETKVDWKTNPMLIRESKGFYEDESAMVDFTHKAINQMNVFESWVFGGMSRKAWKWFGGLNESRIWGPVDIDFQTRRVLLGIQNTTLMGADTYCIHQNHDNDGKSTPTPRNFSKAMANAPVYKSKEEARLHHLDEMED